MTTAQPLWRAYVAFLMPMMLSNILQSLFGTINGIYLGQMIGVDALAAASIFFPVMFFFISFIIGLGAGSSVLIGQAWGARAVDKAKAIAGTTLALTLLGGCVIAVGGGLFARHLMVALATPANVLDAATDYARIMLITMPATFTFLLATAMMRGVGDTVTPLWALAISTLIGLVITPALIRGWFGLPQLGVASASDRGRDLVSRDAVVARTAHATDQSSAGARCSASPRHAARSRTARQGAAHRIAHRGPACGDVARGDRSARHRQPVRLRRHGRLWRRQPGAELCAISGDLDRHHRVDLRGAGDRCRPYRADRCRSSAPGCGSTCC